MKTIKLKRPLAFLMAVLVAVATLGPAMPAMAAGSDGSNELEDLVLYDGSGRTDLDEDEIAVAEDINVLKDSDYDVTDTKDGIAYHEDMVSVEYDAARSDFDLSKAGTYDTYYVARPNSGKAAYLIHRRVYVHEPFYGGNTSSDDAEEEGSEDDSDEPEASALQNLSQEEESDEDWKEEGNEDDPGFQLAGQERANEEFPLSVGEIESIQSNTATFTINLDPGQDAEIIEEGVNPETGADGVEEDKASEEEVVLSAAVPQGGAIKVLSSVLASALNAMAPSVSVNAAEENKDSMQVSYSGHAGFCRHRTGIKYISEAGKYQNHLVYCMDMNRNTTSGTVNAAGKVKAKITFCLVNGARVLGGLCYTAKYSASSAAADYFLTSASIHVLNGEVSLSYYNDGSTVYKKIAEMVNDANNLDKSQYNIETGLTKSITYTISPKATDWKEVSTGLYRSTEKFVRSKSGTVTDVKYKVTGVPSGLTVGEINKDASDIVDEEDLKKYDICVAQTDKDKASSNFYLYANAGAMDKIIAEKSTIKVQAKAYADEKGGRKWTPTVVSQQKITFLEEFNTLSAKSVVKVTCDFKPGSFSFKKTDKFTGDPIDGATYYLYEDKDCDDLLCEMVSVKGKKGLYGSDIQTLTQDTYYLKEIDNPNGFQLDEKVYEISTDYFTFYDASGNVTREAKKEFTHKEKEEPVGVIVTKTDAFSRNEIKNAGFAVFDDKECTKRTVIDADDGDKKVPVFRYDEDLGGAVSDKFMKTQDTYYVKEVEVPDGYLDSGKVWEIKPGIGDVEELLVENTPLRCKVNAVKKDGETGGVAQGDASLAGATYGLYAAEDIGYPDGTGTVSYGSGDAITFAKGTNPDIKKTEAKKDMLLATVKTDTGGAFSFGNLYFGNYYIKEIEPSEGYLLDERVYDVKFKDAKDTHKDIALEVEASETVKKQSFQIIKVSTDGNSAETELVKDAEFTVKLQSEVERSGWDQAKTYDKMTTDDKGSAKSIELPYGTYLVRETKVPKDLYRTEDFTVKISEDSREPQSWRTLNDAPFESFIKIIKKDRESGNAILVSGASFKIKKAGTDEYVEQKVGGKKVGEFTTDETGTVTTPLKLKHGNYEVTEIKAPNGYLLKKDAVPLTVTKEGAVQVAEDSNGDPVIAVEMEDAPAKGSIRIHKEGEVVTGAEYDTIMDRLLTAVTGDNRSVRFQYGAASLKGAVYQLLADEDIYTPDHQAGVGGGRKIAMIGGVEAKKDAVIATLTTDENGEASIDGLPLGKYRIVERQAPEGFVLDGTEKHVELSYQDGQTETVCQKAELGDERVKTQLSIIKKNSATGTPVPEAIYGVYATVDIVARDGTVLVEADKLIESVKTDAEGKAIFEADLPLGKYYVKEIEPAPGYLKAESEYEVDFTYKDQKQDVLTQEIGIQEVPIIVEVSKSDITTGKELAGAKLEILDKNGETYAAWTTSGKPHTLNAMPAGDYTLKETFAPYGYLIANEAVFTVKETGDIQKVSMTDERVKGFIEIYKTDSTKKKSLKGAEFEIRDKNGKVVEKLVTDGDGYARSSELEICTYKDNGDFGGDIKYTVVETKAPAGYVLDSKEHEVVLQYDDSAKEAVGYELHVTNKPDNPGLPQTGGDFKAWKFILTGVILIGAGIAGLVKGRKRRKR